MKPRISRGDRCWHRTQFPSTNGRVRVGSFLSKYQRLGLHGFARFSLGWAAVQYGLSGLVQIMFSTVSKPTLDDTLPHPPPLKSCNQRFERSWKAYRGLTGCGVNGSFLELQSSIISLQSSTVQKFGKLSDTCRFERASHQKYSDSERRSKAPIFPSPMLHAEDMPSTSINKQTIFRAQTRLGLTPLSPSCPLPPRDLTPAPSAVTGIRALRPPSDVKAFQAKLEDQLAELLGVGFRSRTERLLNNRLGGRLRPRRKFTGVWGSMRSAVAGVTFTFDAMDDDQVRSCYVDFYCDFSRVPKSTQRKLFQDTLRVCQRTATGVMLQTRA